jgi:hypothetical protein
MVSRHCDRLSGRQKSKSLFHCRVQEPGGKGKVSELEIFNSVKKLLALALVHTPDKTKDRVTDNKREQFMKLLIVVTQGDWWVIAC